MAGETRLVMGMPVTVEIAGRAHDALFEAVFAHFAAVDARFSLYRPGSEICAINAGRVALSEASEAMREVLAIAERTKLETGGFFDVRRADGGLDPSGIVKGWAIRDAAAMLRAAGAMDFYVDAGGDIQASGKAPGGADWRAGIRNPFNAREIVKAVTLGDGAIATSGTYARGAHIYDPHRQSHDIGGVVSLSVLARDILEADRFATAAFAMGAKGIYFIEARPGLEGYAVDAHGVATQTTGFGAYVAT